MFKQFCNVGSFWASVCEGGPLLSCECVVGRRVKLDFRFPGRYWKRIVM